MECIVNKFVAAPTKKTNADELKKIQQGDQEVLTDAMVACINNMTEKEKTDNGIYPNSLNIKENIS